MMHIPQCPIATPLRKSVVTNCRRPDYDTGYPIIFNTHRMTSKRPDLVSRAKDLSNCAE